MVEDLNGQVPQHFLSIVPSSEFPSLVRVKNSLLIIDKLIGKNIQREYQELLEFLIRNRTGMETGKGFSGFTNKILSRYAPLNKILLERYQEKWNWMLLSSNEALLWTTELIGEYQDKWDWGNLSSNEALPLTTELINQYQDKWDWGNLSSNEALPWTIELIDQYQDKWDWGNLSSNEALPWTTDLIDQYQDKWDWWFLLGNEAVPLSDDLFDWYISKHAEFLDLENSFYIMNNKKLPWSEIFLEKLINLYIKFNDNIEGSDKSKDDIIKTTLLNFLSQNQLFPWSIQFLSKHINQLDFRQLSVNVSVPWSIELLDRFKSKWSWDHLSTNKALPWSIELVNRYSNDLVSWKLSNRNISVYEKIIQPHFSAELIDEVFKK